MPFDYFNPSDLAFGNKLRTAFHQLSDLTRSAQENIEQYANAQEYLDDYDHKNYRIAKPIQPYNPCRSDEFFDIINNRKYVIHNISYNVYDRKVRVDVSLFNNVNKRMTRITGETDIKAGYCYYKQASSNLYYQREAVFSEEPLSGYKQLFYYRVDRNNKVVLAGKIDELGLTPYDSSHYSKMEEDPEVASYNEPYLAKDYECLCVIGHTDELRVRLNGFIIMQGYGIRNQKYCIVYVRPGDQISGEYKRIFRIRYYSDSNLQKEYFNILWNQNNLNLLDEHLIFTSGVEASQGTSEKGYKYNELLGSYGSVNNSSVNKSSFCITSSNHLGTYFASINNELRLGGLKLRPQVGKGLYDGEENEIYRLDFNIMTRVWSNIDRYSMFGPIGDVQMKVVVSMCASDNTIVDQWESAYHLNQTDWRRNSSIDYAPTSIVDYGTKETAPDSSDRPKIHIYSGYFERKLPEGGYLLIDVYGKDFSAKIWNSYDKAYEDISWDTVLLGVIIAPSQLRATFYKDVKPEESEDNTEQEEEESDV